MQLGALEHICRVFYFSTECFSCVGGVYLLLKYDNPGSYSAKQSSLHYRIVPSCYSTVTLCIPAIVWFYRYPLVICIMG